LQGSGEVNNRIRVIERGHEVTPSSERSNLVRQLIEPAPQRGTYLSRCSGHGNWASSPHHAHRFPDLKPRRRVNGSRRHCASQEPSAKRTHMPRSGCLPIEV